MTPLNFGRETRKILVDRLSEINISQWQSHLATLQLAKSPSKLDVSIREPFFCKGYYFGNAEDNVSRQLRVDLHVT